MSRFGFCMLNIIDRQVQLVVVRFRFAAIFGAAVGEHANDAHALFVHERQYAIIEQISSSEAA
jgi:hypothetical protein